MSNDDVLLAVHIELLDVPRVAADRVFLSEMMFSVSPGPRPVSPYTPAIVALRRCSRTSRSGIGHVEIAICGFSDEVAVVERRMAASVSARRAAL